MSGQDIHWYAIRTRCEFEVKRMLDREACVRETYIPLKQKTATDSGGVSSKVSLSLPGFVFVRGNHKELRRCLSANSLPLRLDLGVEKNYDRPMVIPDEDMQRFKDFNENNLPLMWLRNPYLSFAKNDRVRILSGPFAGYEGFVKEIKHDLKLISRFGIWSIAISGIRRYEVTVVANAPACSEAARMARLADYFADRLQSGGKADGRERLLRMVVAGIAACKTRIVAEYRNNLSKEALSDDRTEKLEFLQNLSSEDEATLIQMVQARSRSLSWSGSSPMLLSARSLLSLPERRCPPADITQPYNMKILWSGLSLWIWKKASMTPARTAPKPCVTVITPI